MSPQYWQALGALVVACGALYGVVTAPLLRTIKAEISASEARLKLALVELEKRVNERIDTRLVHR